MSNHNKRSRNAIPKKRRTGLILLTLTAGRLAFAAATEKDLESVFAKGQWDEAAEIAHEILLKNPKAPLPKMRGAYALFQRGYPNSALMMLKTLSAEDWKKLPVGTDRIADIISLFQKKVPLTALPARMAQVNPNDAAPYLRDEINFAKGREAFDKNDLEGAKTYLRNVNKNSRFLSQARYLMATIYVKQKKYKEANAEFSSMLEPQVLNESSEFWQDIGSQMSSHWGSSVKVMLDVESGLNTARRLGELATVGMARVAYATKEYEKAISIYESLSDDSKYYPRIQLERVWSLLNLNKHEDAQKVAKKLTNRETHFEAFEAQPLRALILADHGETEDARDELERFFKNYEAYKMALNRFIAVRTTEEMPVFLPRDLDDDVQLRVLRAYSESLKTEIEKMRQEDSRLFPIYQHLLVRMNPLMAEVKAQIGKQTLEHANRRLADLERLFIQGKLIQAETYLEDREALRREFQAGKATDPVKAKEHDARLVRLLENAVKEVDAAMVKAKKHHPNLELRQAELLWELSRAQSILSGPEDKAGMDKAEGHKRRALQIAEMIANGPTSFPKHAEALFFTGFAQMELGKEVEGKKNLEKYLAMYPKHLHAPDAHRILGDTDFEANRFAAAEARYKKILEFQESGVVGYGLYKIGWCAYNSKNYSKALLALEQAILWADRWGKNDQVLTLEREARRDLISIYAEIGDAKKAPEYFQRFLKGESAPWITELAKQLDTMGQFEKSAELYKYMIDADPASIENVVHQSAMLWGAYKLHRWDLVMPLAKDMVSRYKTQLGISQAEDTPAGKAEKIFRDVVIAHHFEFKNAPPGEDRDRTAQLDALYLSTFDDWATSQAVLYANGLYLLQKKDYVGASTVLRRHWQRFEMKLDPATREEALRNLISSIKEIEAKDKNKAAKLSGNAAELVDLVGEYKKSYPNAKFIRPIAFLECALLFKYNEDARGTTECQKVFNYNPSDEFGKKAFQNLRVSYYDKKDWKRTYEWASELWLRKTPGMENYKATLKTIRQEALFLWADSEPDDVKSAKLFSAIASNEEMKNLWEKALYNAFLRYYRANKKVDALKTAARLEHLSPNFPELPRIAGMRSAHYQEAGDYVSSLPLLLTYIQRADKDTPVDALQQAKLNAGLIFEANGQNTEAVQFLNAYMRQGPVVPAGVDEANHALARIESQLPRSPASEIRGWPQLMKAKAEFEREPIAPKGDLAARLQRGGQYLQQIAKAFMDISGNSNTPEFFAYESYCAVPFLYSSYEQAIRIVSEQTPDDIRAELFKISTPLREKAKEMGEECFRKSSEAEHDGPFYRKALQKWGWQWDPILKDKVEGLLRELEKAGPTFDPLTNAQVEETILPEHIEGRSTEDSWYTLGVVRWRNRKVGFSRLTFVDGLAKYPRSGRMLNALGIIAMQSIDKKGVGGIFERAALSGSKGAMANLTLFHLRGARLQPAYSAMRRGLESGAFDANPAARDKVEELVKK